MNITLDRAAAALLLLTLGVWLSTALAQPPVKADDIKIEFIDARGQPLPFYPVDQRRAYLRADAGEVFAIKVRNDSRERVGLLIAVDGHNAIGGGRARIKPGQRMFVLGPDQTRTYRGWRTGVSHLNPFRFGAAADRRDDGDWSAQPGDGVVTVAVFRESRAHLTSKKVQRHADAARGQGKRHETLNPIAFAPRGKPLVGYAVRYQNRDLLCQRRVVDCAPQRSDLTLRDLSIDVVDDDGRRFAQYPLDDRAGRYRAYLEATPKSNYALRVRNYSDAAIGLVIAVDGRNIISGLRSDLAPSERMYVLGPGESAEYEGWRTGKNRVNRFFFSREEDAYASDWGDRSALGVIAVAAYPQRVSDYQSYESSSTSSTSSRKPGTGFGDSKRSPSREVSFEPQSRPFARYFLKYEWRRELCRKDVIRCERRGAERDGRNPSYAPQPALVLSGPGWHDQYAASAVAQYKDSRRRGCGFRGARWHDDYGRHLGWAQLTSRRKAQLEYNVRREQLRRCR